MPSPPKPWERAAAAAPASSSPPAPSTAVVAAPERPAPLPSSLSSTLSPSSYQSYPENAYSSYNSSHPRFGSSYSPYGYSGSLGMGTYGGMGMGTYGAYGGAGGYGGYGMGMPGMLGPNGLPVTAPGAGGDPSLTHALESTTQHTFALLHSIVQTFTGVAQMLESTFFATHSSFFAMVGVIDQFGQLRNALGSVLGLFGLVRWARDMLAGRSSRAGEMRAEFKDFVNGAGTPSPQQPQPRPSKKPLIIFLLAVFGVPYAMTKLVRALNARQQQQQQNAQDAPGVLSLSTRPTLDPNSLRFARALYAFTPSSPAELGLAENQIVAIMGKLDPSTGREVSPAWEGESEWWKGRTREGKEGWFPSKWVEVMPKREAKVV